MGEDKKLKGTVKSFGIFTIIKDEIKPTIKSVNINEDMRDEKSIKFKPKIHRFFHQKKGSQKVLKKLALEGSRASFWRGLGASWAPLGRS